MADDSLKARMNKQRLRDVQPKKVEETMRGGSKDQARITVYIDKDLKEELHIACVKNGTSMSALAVELLTDYVKNQSS